MPPRAHPDTGPHPDPPARLARRPLPLLAEAGPWLRVHRRDRDPLFFGRTGLHRFDAPEGEYGVLYAAADAHGAFVETFGRTGGERLVTTSGLAAQALARIEAARPLRLVDLAGPGLARLGADARLTTGSYRVAQRWALALWRHPDAPDGLLYRCRHDPSRHAVAVFDRAAEALRAVPVGALADPEQAPLLADVLATYGFGLLDDLPGRA